MKIRLINHAGAFVESGEVCLLFDPWVEGSIFNDGWSLLAPTPDSVRDFLRVTHLWFSHEHPDHFHPPTVSAIPENDREHIEVLFQATEDKRVVSFCRGLGFRVRELPPNQWVELGPGSEVLCSPLANLEGDSWLCLRTPEAVLLNTNDCNPSEEYARAIRQQLPHVDVLMTQFSGAQWTGNTEARERRRQLGPTNLAKAVTQCRELGVRWVVPFASFAWFSHVENFYLNEYAVRLDTAVREIEARVPTRPVALYPGDAWTVGSNHDNDRALERWNLHYEAVHHRRLSLSKSRVVEHEALIEASRRFFEKLASQSSQFLVRVYLAMASFYSRSQLGIGKLPNLLALVTLRVNPVHLWITDLERSYRLDLARLRPTRRAAAECDLRLSADSLMNCFATEWGGETLVINGRFQERADWESRPHWSLLYRFFDRFRLARRIQRGYRLDWSVVGSSLRRRLKLI